MYQLRNLMFIVNLFYTDANYSCVQCQAQFVEKYNFDLHLKYSQVCCGANPQVFKCGKCGEVFTTLINLQQHIRRHKQNNHLTSTYSSSQEVFNSSTSQTPIPAGNSKWQSSGESNREDLQELLQTPCGSHSNECLHHNKTQQLEQGKQSEEKDQVGHKPYKCQHCNLSFSRRSALKCHLLIYSDEDPDQLLPRNKVFASKHSLKMNLQSSEKKPCNGKEIIKYPFMGKLYNLLYFIFLLHFIH